MFVYVPSLPTSMSRFGGSPLVLGRGYTFRVVSYASAMSDTNKAFVVHATPSNVSVSNVVDAYSTAIVRTVALGESWVSIELSAPTATKFIAVAPRRI